MKKTERREESRRKRERRRGKQREKESERVREVTCVRASYKLRRSWKTTKGGKRWSKRQTTCIIDVPVSPASLCLFSSLFPSLFSLFSSLLPVSATPPLFRVSPSSASSCSPSPSPDSPLLPLKTPMRVFQFPIHSTRNPGRRLSPSLDISREHAHTYTFNKILPGFRIRAKGGGNENSTEYFPPYFRLAIALLARLARVRLWPWDNLAGSF